MNDFEKKNTISRYSCQNVNGSRAKDLSLFMYEIVQEKGNLRIYLVVCLCVLSILVINWSDWGGLDNWDDWED